MNSANPTPVGPKSNTVSFDGDVINKNLIISSFLHCTTRFIISSHACFISSTCRLRHKRHTNVSCHSIWWSEKDLTIWPERSYNCKIRSDLIWCYLMQLWCIFNIYMLAKNIHFLNILSSQTTCLIVSPKTTHPPTYHIYHLYNIPEEYV